jgi:hypothetical protein
MSLCIFTGPTLSPEDARAEEPDALVLPPAARGDVYRAALQRPLAIGLVDGGLGHGGVCHQEILWALSQGIHVFGGAAVGALRAVELSAFGMEGVGEVFEAFRSGRLEDEDEVAVAPAPAASVSMVNIRATLAAARAQGVIRSGTGERIESGAKRVFYAERTYPRVLARALEEGVPAPEVDALRDWLPENAVDQQRLDAVAMLRTMRARLAGPVEPRRVSFTFERTDEWVELERRSARAPPAPEAGRESALRAALLEELQASGDLARIHQGALARALALELARRAGLTPSGELLRRTAASFRRERGLSSAEALGRWCREQGVTDLDRFLRDEAAIRWAEAVLAPDLGRCLLDELRKNGELPDLLARAEARAAGNNPLHSRRSKACCSGPTRC